MIGDDLKSFSADPEHTPNCFRKHCVVTSQSVPPNGSPDFHLQIGSGGRCSDIGCFDAAGIVTTTFDPRTDTLGDTTTSWSVHFYPDSYPSELAGAHHAGTVQDTNFQLLKFSLYRNLLSMFL